MAGEKKKLGQRKFTPNWQTVTHLDQSSSTWFKSGLRGCSDWLVTLVFFSFSLRDFKTNIFREKIVGHLFCMKHNSMKWYKVVLCFYICGIEMSRNLIIKKKQWFLSFHQLRATELDGKRKRRRGPWQGWQRKPNTTSVTIQPNQWAKRHIWRG